METQNQPITVQQPTMIAAIDRAEIDMQVSTAKQFPRDIQASLNRIKTIATLDTEAAADCFYVLSRQGTRIEGVSVRLAEIIAGAWGNLRVQTRIIGNDGKTITAQGVCHDLESNFAVCVEVKRRITDRHGNTYSEDMQVTTGNAASAIAFRNAVLKVVPKAVTARVVNDIKEVAMGRALDLESSRTKMIDYFAKLGVTKAEILSYLGVSKVEKIDQAMVFELRGVANALKEGTTTVQETFKANTADNEAQATAARSAAEAAKARAAKAMGQSPAPAAEAPAQAAEIADNGGIDMSNGTF